MKSDFFNLLMAALFAFNAMFFFGMFLKGIIR